MEIRNAFIKYAVLHSEEVENEMKLGASEILPDSEEDFAGQAYNELSQLLSYDYDEEEQETILEIMSQTDKSKRIDMVSAFRKLEELDFIKL